MVGGIALLATLGLSFAAFAGPSQDTDSDGVYDVLDNCLTVPNGPPIDCDADNDGYGNVCDGDFDQDFFVFPGDFAIWFAAFGSGIPTSAGEDMDCDGYVFPGDFTVWNGIFNSTGSPGPSGLHCAGSVPCDL
jgi:hypothetical protein